MGGLSHYIEDEGIPTTQISLIREHSEIIQPPRALWVPFDLGRPFGVPNKPDFQRAVLEKVLSLLEYEKGPVLEDYPIEAEDTSVQPAQLACPVNFNVTTEAVTSTEKLFQSFRAEIASMQTWHDIGAKKNQRSTTGVSGMTPDKIANLFQDFIEGKVPSGGEHVKLSDLLRMATEDIKAFYLEAISAQPGQPTDVQTLSDWFWGETSAAQVINKVRTTCFQFEAKDMLLAGKLLLVPRNQMYRFKD